MSCDSRSRSVWKLSRPSTSTNCRGRTCLRRLERARAVAVDRLEDRLPAPQVPEVLAHDVEVVGGRGERRDPELGSVGALVAVVVVAADVRHVGVAEHAGEPARESGLAGAGVAYDAEDDRTGHASEDPAQSRSSMRAIFCRRCSAMRSEAASISRPSSETAPLPSRGGLLHRGDDPARARDQLLVGREDAVGQLDLVGVDRPLALEAEHRGAAGRGEVAVGVVEVAERPVDRPQPVGAAGDRDAGQRVVPLVAPVELARTVLARVGEHRVAAVRAADRGVWLCIDAA